VKIEGGFQFSEDHGGQNETHFEKKTKQKARGQRRLGFFLALTVWIGVRKTDEWVYLRKSGDINCKRYSQNIPRCIQPKPLNENQKISLLIFVSPAN